MLSLHNGRHFLTRIFMKCFIIQWTIIILDKTCFGNLYVIWLSKKALKTVWPFDILYILLGFSNFCLSKSTAIFTFLLFSRVAILCSASSTAVVVSSTFWCSGLTLEIIILWYLTTPMTHLHRAPQAELLVFLSKASGSKLGFFRYGSTKSSVDSGSWLSSNDINSSMNLKSINFYHSFKFATCNIFKTLFHSPQLKIPSDIFKRIKSTTLLLLNSCTFLSWPFVVWLLSAMLSLLMEISLKKREKFLYTMIRN